ncbi:MAG: hypothetical protein CL908_19730 [Deltaproteobacteria bacterium]|nr:hypothetical protein [Deltaproteobacteria bacterium]
MCCHPPLGPVASARLVLAIAVFLLPELFALSLAASAGAKVLSIEIDRREPILEGRPFADRGGYELIEGRVRFGFDPDSAANARVTDIDLAPIGPNGLVEATSDFVVLQAMDPAKRSGTALVGVPNRGRRLELMMLDRAALSFTVPAPLDPRAEADWGDGFLMESGLTVMWVGWQADAPDFAGSMRIRVPHARHRDESPIRGLARSDWVVDERSERLELPTRGHAAHLAADPASKQNLLTRRRGREATQEALPRSSWSFAEDRSAIVAAGGFDPGWIYELVYTAENPPLVGLGFAAFRDFVAYARNDTSSPFPIERAIADGSSQSGRFLRHFLYEGFHRDETDRAVFDGVIIRIAGGGRGGFNHRFSHPGRVGNPYENFFYPGDDFPFTSRPTRDGNERRGLLDRARGTGELPRLFQINTGYEYWGRAASLVHMTTDGREDVEPLPNERLYHIASAPHGSVPFPPSPESEVAPGLFRGSTVDTSDINRALLRHMQLWVEEEIAPPPSVVPAIADGTLVEAASLRYPLASLATPRSPHVAYRMNFGSHWSDGIIDQQPPKRGAALAIRVPAVDALGNEATGIRPLEVRVPVGSYVPWALRTGFSTASDEMVGYLGSFIPLARADELRHTGDARPSLESLYPTRDAYETKVAFEIDTMVENGWLLRRDRVHAFRAAIERWEWVNQRGYASASPARPASSIPATTSEAAPVVTVPDSFK